MPFVAFGREVRVVLDGENSATIIDVESRRRDDLRMLGEEFNLQPRIERLGRIIRAKLRSDCQDDEAEYEPIHEHDPSFASTTVTSPTELSSVV